MPDQIPMPPRPPVRPKTYPICSLERIVEIINKECGNVYIKERQGKGRNKVILLPESAQELTAITSYGRRSPMNAAEQKVLGFGHFFLDEDGNDITIVSHFIEIPTMNRSVVSADNLGPNGEYNHGLDFLEYHRDEFLRNESKYNTDAFGYLVDPFLKICGHSEFVLEGHTHPDLGVFYSKSDQMSGAARAASSPVCIFVCDPIRKKMLASVGKEFSKAEVLVYARADNVREAPAGEELYEDERISPSERIIDLAVRCLQICGFEGRVRISRRPGGKRCLRIRLVMPGTKEVSPNDNDPGKVWR